MTFPVFLDTCALFGGSLCDLLLRLAEAGTYRPLWSGDVLDELRRNLTDRVGADAAGRRVSAMTDAFPEAMVTHYEPLIDGMTCDPKDRHVLAAAVRSDAATLVTFNLDDFPAESASPYDIEVVHPDDFLLDQIDLHPDLTRQAIRRQVDDARRPPLTVPVFLATLSRSGVPAFADEARRHDI